MVSRYTKILIGAFVLLSTLAVFMPILYPDRGDTGVATPRDIPQEATTANDQVAKEAPAEPELPQNNEFADASSPEDEYATGGYGNLLDDQGAPAPANSDSSGKPRAGVYVGIIPEEEQKTFVNNPTATGTTPADAARAQEEARRQKQQDENLKRQQNLEEQQRAQRLQQQQEAQRKLEEAKKLEAQRKLEDTQRKIEESKKLEAQRKLEEAQKQQLAQQEAQRKAAEEQARQKLEAEKQKAQELAKSSNDNKYPLVPSGHYLQVGAYSTVQTAEGVRSLLKARKIAIDKQYRNELVSGFGYKIEARNGKYYVLVGPAKAANVLRSIKPNIDAAANTNSFVVGR